jgi:hypothetical protein
LFGIHKYALPSAKCARAQAQRVSLVFDFCQYHGWAYLRWCRSPAAGGCEVAGSKIDILHFSYSIFVMRTFSRHDEHPSSPKIVFGIIVAASQSLIHFYNMDKKLCGSCRYNTSRRHCFVRSKKSQSIIIIVVCQQKRRRRRRRAGGGREYD